MLEWRWRCKFNLAPDEVFDKCSVGFKKILNNFGVTYTVAVEGGGKGAGTDERTKRRKGKGKRKRRRGAEREGERG